MWSMKNRNVPPVSEQRRTEEIVTRIGKLKQGTRSVHGQELISKTPASSQSRLRESDSFAFLKICTLDRINKE